MSCRRGQQEDDRLGDVTGLRKTAQRDPRAELLRVAFDARLDEPIVFLLSSAARHITGTELFIDGGESVF